ncbi:hypothetical protein BDR07DRAFT_282576 [Suillus spraguei]|nr:hypothetical protein BDR07DRAFT_282576 [Suillus spraguei]
MHQACSLCDALLMHQGSDTDASSVRYIFGLCCPYLALIRPYLALLHPYLALVHSSCPIYPAPGSTLLTYSLLPRFALIVPCLHTLILWYPATQYSLYTQYSL